MIDITDNLEPGAYIHRHLVTDNTIAANIEIYWLGPEFSVKQQNLYI